MAKVKERLRNDKTNWCVAREPTNPMTAGPIVWGWFRWRWQAESEARRIRHHLSRDRVYYVMSAAHLDDRWRFVDHRWCAEKGGMV